MPHGHMSIFRQAENGFNYLWHNIIFLTGKETNVMLLTPIKKLPISCYSISHSAYQL